MFDFRLYSEVVFKRSINQPPLVKEISTDSWHECVKEWQYWPDSLSGGRGHARSVSAPVIKVNCNQHEQKVGRDIYESTCRVENSEPR